MYTHVHTCTRVHAYTMAEDIVNIVQETQHLFVTVLQRLNTMAESVNNTEGDIWTLWVLVCEGKKCVGD